MQIWNMKMKMAVIKVIYEAPQSHLWRRHDSLVSFMCGRPSCAWRASLPAPASLQGRSSAAAAAATAATLLLLLSVCVWLIAPSRTLCATVIYIFNKIGTRWLPPLSQNVSWTVRPNRQPHHASPPTDTSRPTPYWKYINFSYTVLLVVIVEGASKLCVKIGFFVRRV